MRIFTPRPGHMALYIDPQELPGSGQEVWLELAGQALETLGFRRDALRQVECFPASDGGALLFVGLEPPLCYYAFDDADALLDFLRAARRLPWPYRRPRLFMMERQYILELCGGAPARWRWLALEFSDPLPAGPHYGAMLMEHGQQLALDR